MPRHSPSCDYRAIRSRAWPRLRDACAPALMWEPLMPSRPSLTRRALRRPGADAGAETRARFAPGGLARDRPRLSLFTHVLSQAERAALDVWNNNSGGVRQCGGPYFHEGVPMSLAGNIE